MRNLNLSDVEADASRRDYSSKAERGIMLQTRTTISTLLDTPRPGFSLPADETATNNVNYRENSK
jgi:hypothetical protein